MITKEQRSLEHDLIKKVFYSLGLFSERMQEWSPTQLSLLETKLDELSNHVGKLRRKQNKIQTEKGIN